jgi:hypothetical protein
LENPRKLILIMMIAVNVEAVGKAGMGGCWLQDRRQNGEPGRRNAAWLNMENG